MNKPHLNQFHQCEVEHERAYLVSSKMITNLIPVIIQRVLLSVLFEEYIPLVYNLNG